MKNLSLKPKLHHKIDAENPANREAMRRLDPTSDVIDVGEDKLLKKLLEIHLTLFSK